VEFTSTGTLALNQAVFDEAIATDGNAVRQLFAGPGGVFPAIETVLEEYTTANGFISMVKDRLTRQITAMDTQIASMQRRLALQRESMQRQFTEADAAMSRLRSQSSSLASLGIGSF
jgi:flagellar hook-associated protein 2